MTITFKFVNKLSDPGTLHKLLAQYGFNVEGVTCETGGPTTWVLLADTETKDPTIITNDYSYAPPIIYDYPSLYVVAQATVSNAKTTLQDAVTQYDTAAANYINALNAFNTAGSPINTANAVSHLQPMENQIVALASACQAFKSAFQAVVSEIDNLNSVVAILAQRDNVI